MGLYYYLSNPRKKMGTYRRWLFVPRWWGINSQRRLYSVINAVVMASRIGNADEMG
jgi:hypothetical protein